MVFFKFLYCYCHLLTTLNFYRSTVLGISSIIIVIVRETWFQYSSENCWIFSMYTHDEIGVKRLTRDETSCAGSGSIFGDLPTDGQLRNASLTCARTFFTVAAVHAAPSLEFSPRLESNRARRRKDGFSQRNGCLAEPCTARRFSFLLSCTCDANFNLWKFSSDRITRTVSHLPWAVSATDVALLAGTHTNATPRSVPWRANSCPHVWSPPSTGRHIA